MVEGWVGDEKREYTCGISKSNLGIAGSIPTMPADIPPQEALRSVDSPGESVLGISLLCAPSSSQCSVEAAAGGVVARAMRVHSTARTSASPWRESASQHLEPTGPESSSVNARVPRV